MRYQAYPYPRHPAVSFWGRAAVPPSPVLPPSPIRPGLPIAVPPGIMPVAGVGQVALGKTFVTTLKTPFGNKSFSVNVPYESVANSAVKYTVAQLKKEMPALLDKALKQAGSYVTSTLVPQLKPQLRSEIDRAIRQGKIEADKAVGEATKNAAFIATGIVVAMFGVGWWIRSAVKKKG